MTPRRNHHQNDLFTQVGNSRPLNHHEGYQHERYHDYLNKKYGAGPAQRLSHGHPKQILAGLLSILLAAALTLCSLSLTP
jgi:hypothetical protein